MADIKAITTYYNGLKFRSRLEARWAVFFDAANISYEYEPEGFKLENGLCYLPDFYLPDDDVWVEIKGKKLDDMEHEKIERFCAAKCDFANGGSRFRLLEGQIPNELIALDNGVVGIPAFNYISPDEFLIACKQLNLGLNDKPAKGVLLFAIWLPSCGQQTMIDALTKARQARFEHGEKG